MSENIAKQEQHDLAMVDIANAVHQGNENTPPPHSSAQPKSEM